MERLLKLTPKMQRAVLAYRETAAKTEAYRRAYDCSRMKPATVRRKATVLFAKPHVARAVRELQVAAVEASGLTTERVLGRLEQIAFGPATLDAEGDETPIDAGHRLKALDMIAKHLGLYEKDRQQQQPVLFQISYTRPGGPGPPGPPGGPGGPGRGAQ